MLDRSHTHRSNLNPLGLFVAACSETQRDGDDECNLFHRNTSSFNLPDCANSPAIKCFPSACKIMVRVSSGGSRRRIRCPRSTHRPGHFFWQGATDVTSRELSS